MSDVIGRGVIEVSADAGKLNASIAEARRSIASLGDANQSANAKSSASIDRYVSRLQVSQKTIAMTAREAELYKLSLRGASDEQLRAANSALRMTEAYKFGQDIGDKLKAAGILAATGILAASVAFDQLLKKTSEFQDMAEKIGDTAENVASLSLAAAGGGASMEEVISASTRMTQALTGVNDESKAAGAAITALGLDLESFKKLSPADQIEAVAKAMAKFDESKEKTAVAMALFGEAGAKTMPFLRELGKEGARQVILTQQQIDLADEYADKQAVLVGQISLHAQAIALEMLPAVNDLVGAFDDLLKSYVDTNKGATDLANNHAIEDFADAAVSALAFVVDAGDGVARVFELAGKSIAAATVIATSPIQQSKAIFQSWQDDMDAILSRPQLGQLLEQRREARKSEAQNPASTSPDVEKPKLAFDGVRPSSKGSASTAAADAKARLSADLADIKRASEAQLVVYSNTEKIVQAMRAANLLEEGDYYEAKAQLIRANAVVEEQELQREIERLRQENLSGKERIDNDRKIIDAEAKLSKLRADTATDLQVNSIQSQAALASIQQAYDDARSSAEAYLETVARQNARAVEGIGKGNRFRENQSSINQIEDKFTTRKTTLDDDRRRGQITQQAYDTYLQIARQTYEREVALHQDSREQILTAQGDWKNGMTEAYQNYMDESDNVAKQTEARFTTAYQTIEQSMSDFLFDPFDKGLKGMLQSFGTMLQRMIADAVAADISKHLIGSVGTPSSGGLFSSLIGLFGGGGTSDVAQMAGVFTGRALGGPVSAGQIVEVNERRPELLNVAGRQYLMMGSEPGKVDANTGQSGGGNTIIVNVNGNQSAPDVRRAAGQGAREAMNAINGARRYA